MPIESPVLQVTNTAGLIQIDTEPPTLNSLTLSSLSVDVSSGPVEVEISVGVSDDLSDIQGISVEGFCSSQVGVDLDGAAYVRIQNSYNAFFDMSRSPLALTSGTTRDGVWRGPGTLRGFTPPCDIDEWIITVCDDVGCVTYQTTAPEGGFSDPATYPADWFTLPMPIESPVLQVTNTAGLIQIDTEPPTLNSFTLSIRPATSPPGQPDVPTPTVTPGSASFVLPDGTSSEVAVEALPSGVRIAGAGVSLTVQGAQPTRGGTGLRFNAGGDIQLALEAPVAPDEVIEVYIYSEPRLLAAARSDGTGVFTFAAPTSAPLDGGPPIPPGEHTLQMRIPTSGGILLVNVGLEIRRAIPTRVPAGSGSGSSQQLVGLLLAALTAGLAVRVQRREAQP